MEVEIFKLSFNSIEIARRDIPKIRGYISSTYPEFDELHNHKADGFIYRYPLIQYKSIDNVPCIIGINEGAQILMELENKLNKISINKSDIKIYEKGISYKSFKYGAIDYLLRYRFISPWMCLNEINYKNYIRNSEETRAELLKSILIGNLLSMSKRFNYKVERQLNAYINLLPCKINFKNQKMIGFKGEFLVNFQIPDFMAIGKSVSRGFGTVKLIETKSFV